MHIGKLARCLDELSTSRTVAQDHRAAADIACQLAQRVQAEYQIDWNAPAPEMLRAVENDLPLRSLRDMGGWVITAYFDRGPAKVYGLFNSDHDARAYAEAHGFALGGGAYDIQAILNINHLGE